MPLTGVPRRTIALVTLALGAALLTGCADTDGAAPASPDASPVATGSAPAGDSAPTENPSSPAASGSPGLPRTPLPTLRPPNRPPKTPSDLISGDWLVGTVTRGGSGPCYGLVTDDGDEYALYGVTGVTLTRGSRIRIRTAPLQLKIDCGSGRPLSLLAAEPIR